MYNSWKIVRQEQHVASHATNTITHFKISKRN